MCVCVCACVCVCVRLVTYKERVMMLLEKIYILENCQM